MVWRANKYEVDGEGQFAVRLKHISGRQFWFDLWFENGSYMGTPYVDITGDWNQYIFCLTDQEDVARKKMQENCNNFEQALENSIDYLIKKGVIEKNCTPEVDTYIQLVFA